MDLILVDEPRPSIKRITFNAPERLNAFTFDMYDTLFEILDMLRYDAGTRVIILTGAGRAFCSGHFLGRGGTPSWIRQDVGTIQQNRLSLEQLGKLPVALRAMPQPVIAAVNGPAAGVGYALALAADLAIAASSAKFVNSIHNAATGTELGMSYMLPRSVGMQHAAEILLTARPVLADEAERIGLVLRTVQDEALMDEALKLAEAIVVNHPLGIWLTKQSLHHNQECGSLAAAVELEHRAVIIAQATEDAKEKRAAFAEKRPPTFTHR